MSGCAPIVRAFEAGERHVDALLARVRAPIEAVATSIDYVALANADSVVPFPAGSMIDDRAVLAVAVRFGSTRLIDNVVLGEERGPADVVAG